MLFQIQIEFEILSPFYNNWISVSFSCCTASWFKGVNLSKNNWQSVFFPAVHRFKSEVLIPARNPLRFFVLKEIPSPESQQLLQCICQCWRCHTFPWAITFCFVINKCHLSIQALAWIGKDWLHFYKLLKGSETKQMWECPTSNLFPLHVCPQDTRFAKTGHKSFWMQEMCLP